ncbi:hypothetical protein LJC19_04905 [Oxalobacter sp. OttesenSCG-928-P03]|nr:hypothetical protein [Oxalobacter sp. OttesenSCG-928-P03]
MKIFEKKTARQMLELLKRHKGPVFTGVPIQGRLTETVHYFKLVKADVAIQLASLHEDTEIVSYWTGKLDADSGNLALVLGDY